MKQLLFQVISAAIGFWIATQFIGGVELKTVSTESFLGIQFTQQWQILLFCGAILGLINFFIKPIVKTLTSPLRLLTFGLFGIIINMTMVWIVDILFKELNISGLIPLFWTTIIIWLTSFIIASKKL